jgi:hypothetical protein
LKKGNIMKSFTKRTMWIVFCVLTGSVLFFACAQTAGQAKKSALVSKFERYEDNVIGFSIEYDAEKLAKDLGPIGPFAFRRESAEGMPSVAITAGPYPAGTALEDTAEELSSASLRNWNDGIMGPGILDCWV